MKDAEIKQNLNSKRLGSVISALKNCGAKKVESLEWDCTCGEKSVKGKFCPNCGNKKE